MHELSERAQKPARPDAPPSATGSIALALALPLTRPEEWRRAKWIEAAALAVHAQGDALRPGVTLRLEDESETRPPTRHWRHGALVVTARATVVEPTAAHPTAAPTISLSAPPCGCHTCRTLAAMGDTPGDAAGDGP